MPSRGYKSSFRLYEMVWNYPALSHRFSDTPVYHMKLVGCTVVKPDNEPSRAFHLLEGIVQYSGFPSNRFLGSPHMPWSCSLSNVYHIVGCSSVDTATNCKDPIVGWMTMPHVLSFDHGASVNFTMNDGNGSYCG